jgi:hypothetical protein
VTTGWRLFETVYVTGSVVLIASITLQALLRIDALFPALLIVGCSRIGLAVWQLARPDCSRTPRTKGGLLFLIVAWASTIVALIWIHQK